MKRIFSVLLLALCLGSLLISLHLFYQQAIVIDQLNLSASELYGGEAQLLLAWLRLLLLAGAALLSGIACFRK